MIYKFWLALFFIIHVKAFLFEQANITTWLSAAAYCNKNNYANMKLNGPASGFIVKDIVSNIKSDIQGYIGILPSTQNIYIAFRGSSSIRNWIQDLEFKKVDYITFPSCKCKVHDGFYNSALGIIDEISQKIKLLKLEYKNYNIIVTGHSYGAAVSQLIAMELFALGIESSVYNFGQPRIGDHDYAVFVNSKIKNLWRVVHNRDIVPHVPPIKELDYFHSCQEVFEDVYGNIKICSSLDCEDPTCSDQYKLKETNTKDHEIYLGHNMNCDDSIILI
jgi:hypothetical protein